MNSLRSYLIAIFALPLLLGACAGGPSEDQQATLVAVAVEAALEESAKDAPVEDEAPSAEEKPAADDAAEGPIVVFQPDGLFSEDDRNLLYQKLINPFIDYYADLEGHPALVSLSIEKFYDSGYPYGANAIFDEGVTLGFLFGNADGSVDWWVPGCIGGCPFSEAFKDKYPEIMAIAIPREISGIVWHDLCATPFESGAPAPAGCLLEASTYYANGLFEAGEPGIANVEVRLGAGACPSAGLSVVFTDGNGYYLFSSLDPGSYCVSVEVLPANESNLIPGGWTYPSRGGNLKETTVILAGGESNNDVNFGWDFQFAP